MGKEHILQDFKVFCHERERHEHGCRCSYRRRVWKDSIVVGGECYYASNWLA